jgi:3-phosphoshikimate 1-carboxyvinyltransferase
MKVITVHMGRSSLRGTVTLPSSKSISNRMLIIRALSAADLPIEGLSEADDTQILQELLQRIHRASGKERVTELDTKNAGTVMRFLTAFLSMRPGRWVLTGSDRMKQRPIGELVDALLALGADIEYLAKPGYPPLLLKGKALQGGKVSIEPGVSSQYVSALMMVSPLLPEGLSIRFTEKPVSFPYIEMTASIMKAFGIRAKVTDKGVTVPAGNYRPAAVSVEPDWSSAAFWYMAAALAEEAEILLPGLEQESLQGDSILPLIYENLGVRTEFTPEGALISHGGRKAEGFYFDFTGHPDLAPPVITTCAALGIRGRFEGLRSLHIKETDRLLALRTEFDKMGIAVEGTEISDMLEAIELAPVKKKRFFRSEVPVFETYHDHRMAMTFAPLSLKLGTIRITNPDVVVKSYPGFWQELEKLGFEVRW